MKEISVLNPFKQKIEDKEEEVDNLPRNGKPEEPEETEQKNKLKHVEEGEDEIA